jgi:hypothetical protein
VRALQKKMQQLENDLDQAQEQLLAANAKLEEKDKALQNVSHPHIIFSFSFFVFLSLFIHSLLNDKPRSTKPKQSFSKI